MILHPENYPLKVEILPTYSQTLTLTENFSCEAIPTRKSEESPSGWKRMSNWNEHKEMKNIIKGNLTDVTDIWLKKFEVQIHMNREEPDNDF